MFYTRRIGSPQLQSYTKLFLQHQLCNHVLQSNTKVILQYRPCHS